MGFNISRGHFFSWYDRASIFSRIDNAIAISDWLVKYVGVEVDYLNPGISYHSPLVLDSGVAVKGGGRPFKFFNYLVNDPQFKVIVEGIWHDNVTSTLRGIWAETKLIKQKLRELHLIKFKGVRDHIMEKRSELAKVQELLKKEQLDREVLDEEKKVMRKL